MILDNGSAHRSSKLVTLEGRYFVSIEIVPGIQRAVPKKLVNTSMKLIGSRTCNGIDDATGRFSVFRRVVAGQDRKFLDGVYTQVPSQDAAWSSVCVIVQANAIQPIIVLLRPGARDRQLLSETAISSIRAGGEGWLGLDCVDPRL